MSWWKQLFGKRAATAYCQTCRKPKARQKMAGNRVHFFCSPSCEAGYFEVGSGKKTLSHGTFSFSSTGEPVFYCWACGQAIRTTASTCPSCGKTQEMTL